MLGIVASIGGLIPGLFGREITRKAALVVGWIILAILTVAVFLLLKRAYDASVVNEHESKDRAAKAEKQLDAERAADAAAEDTQKALANTQRKLDEATRDAERSNPAGAASPVGPVSQSYYETLRKERR